MSKRISRTISDVSQLVGKWLIVKPLDTLLPTYKKEQKIILFKYLLSDQCTDCNSQLNKLKEIIKDKYITSEVIEIKKTIETEKGAKEVSNIYSNQVFIPMQYVTQFISIDDIKLPIEDKKNDNKQDKSEIEAPNLNSAKEKNNETLILGDEDLIKTNIVFIGLVTLISGGFFYFGLILFGIATIGIGVLNLILQININYDENIENSYKKNKNTNKSDNTKSNEDPSNSSTSVNTQPSTKTNTSKNEKNSENDKKEAELKKQYEKQDKDMNLGIEHISKCEKTILCATYIDYNVSGEPNKEFELIECYQSIEDSQP